MASNGRRNGPGRPVGARKGASRPPAAGRKPRSRTTSSASVRPADGEANSPATGGEAAVDRGADNDPTADHAGAETRARGAAGDPGRGRLPVTKRAAVLALVIAALVVSYASSLRAWVDQRSQIDELEASVAERRQEVRDLERELARWEDPAYVKAQARERFGWVMPGETGYVVVDRDGRTPNQQPEPASDPGPTAPWWQTLWGSVQHAGNPPAPSPDEEPKPRQPAEEIGP